MSVLIINEEKETAGINKKNKEHERASYFSSPIFLLKLYTDKAIKKQVNTGISFKLKKLSPNTVEYIPITHDKRGGFEK